MDIRLKSLHLENFKCHKNLTIAFEGRDTSIYGDNATGKTSVYDALTWLLFGKDSLGNGEKAIEIKPLGTDGSVLDHEAVTVVEAVLLVDLEELKLTRTFKELWSTKRGSVEASYDGNTSEYSIDGVPCKANAYKAKVAELVDEEKFRLLTSVSYFAATMPWQKRREVLFDLFGGLDDRAIMGMNERFAPLLEAMGKRSLEDTKKVLTQEKKGLTVTRNEVPARISECEKTIEDLAGLDYDGAKAEWEALKDRESALTTELLSIRQNTAVREKQTDLREAQGALTALEAENNLFRREQERNKPNVAAVEERLASTRKIIRRLELTLEGLDARKGRLDSKIETARNRWKAVNAETYQGEDTCPTCGQKLPEERTQAAREAFEADKRLRLERLVAEANELKASKAEEKGAIRSTTEDLEDARKDAENQEAELAQAKAAAAGIEISDEPGYDEQKAVLEGRIRQAQEDLRKLQADSETASRGIQQRIREVQEEISRCGAILGKRSAYDYAQQRVRELRDSAKVAAESLARVEGLLRLMEEYSRYKADFAEAGVNEHFRLAKFRLFREQANGGTEDRCDVTYDGVPYTGLNNGMKINVGIDIINALSRAYRVAVPLFIDNAESVTNLENCRCQVIRLVVSEQDKELRIV